MSLCPRASWADNRSRTRCCRSHGETLEDFVNMGDSCTAQLTDAHVASLRLYTTACFASLNDPLRDTNRTTAHPFPTTIFFLTDAIKRLRAVHVACALCARVRASHSVLYTCCTLSHVTRGGRHLPYYSSKT